MDNDAISKFLSQWSLPPEAATDLRRLSLSPGVSLPGDAIALSEDTFSSSPTPKDAARLGPYEDLGPIGSGGMAEVRRVRDPVLNRVMAAKMLHENVTHDPQRVLRFVEEAQVTAQLRHPSIVAVHELRRNDDGRIYFTMAEVRGQTLVEVVDELHAASRSGRWGRSTNDWTLERLIEAFRRACEAVAYAHSRGVVHRDLKPANVMVGRFGEVILLDWGLAKVFNQGHSEDKPVVTRRSIADATQTQHGRVLGTPAYMPPEQARGELDRVGTASDVYALGAILYTILSGRAPYAGKSGDQVLRARLSGPPRPLSEWEGLPDLPEHLRVICEKAMSSEPTARHYDAAELAQDVGSWLDGSQRQAKALDLVRKAAATLPTANTLAEEARRLHEEARERLEPIANHEPIDRKRPGWVLEDLAVQLEAKAGMRVLEAIRTLRAALNLAPDLAEVHEALADVYKQQHEEAEARGDSDEAERLEVLLRDHDRGRLRQYLDGTGALTLHTDPPGARARIYRYVERDRRLQPEYFRELGTTPLEAVPLAMGSYLVELEVEGRPVVRYPVVIGRNQHWDGRPPGARQPLAIRIPECLASDEIYVPAGWAQNGGDEASCDSWLPKRQVWVDAMVFKTHPITNGDYLAFLNDLEQSGRSRDVQRFLPRFEGFPPYEKDREGTWKLRNDMLIFESTPEHPVVMVDWTSAAAYADWYSRRTGLPWALPDEISWEKAARGVDGRVYPWGNHLDPTWCNMRESRAGRPALLPVGEFEADASPYGVRGMGGNSMDWCRDAFKGTGPPMLRSRAVVREDPGQPRSIRGGHFYAVGQISRVCHRYRLDPAFRAYMLGFRLMRPAG